MEEELLKQVSKDVKRDIKLIEIMFYKSKEEGFNKKESIKNIYEFYRIKKYAIGNAIGENFNIYKEY